MLLMNEASNIDSSDQKRSSQTMLFPSGDAFPSRGFHARHTFPIKQ